MDDFYISDSHLKVSHYLIGYHIFVLADLFFFMSDKSDMIHTKECTYRNNHDFRHDNCFCTCHPKNEKKKGNLKPELRKNME